MTKIISIIIIIIVVFLAAWVVYPASLPARSFVSRQLSGGEYADIKEVLFFFAASNEAHGVTARGEPGPQGTAALYCHGVPLVVVLQAPTVTTMQVFQDSERRAPSLGPVVAQVLSKMILLDQPEKPSERTVGYLERLVLKYRDGVDLDETCAI